MKLFLQANDRTRLRETATWEQLLTGKALLDLECWCSTREREWGPANVILEAVVPRGERSVSKKNQIDLLICFGDRVACCEMKQHFRASRDWVEKSWSQINEQQRWMGQLFKEQGYDERSLRMFLFCPNLDAANLQKARAYLRDLHSAPHVWAIGAAAELRELIDDERRPYYLTEALEKSLTVNLSKSNAARNISSYILNLMQRAGSRLLPFASFDGLLQYLRTVAPAKRHFIWEPGYVPEAFSGDIMEASRQLKVQRAVELVGPPGCGKSTIAKELIEAFELPWFEVELRNEPSRSDITQRVYEAVHDRSSVLNIPEETVIEGLARETGIIWLKRYDSQSSHALQDFIAAFRLIHDAAAYLIVESLDGLTTLCAFRHEVAPLSNQIVYQIVDQGSSGGLFHNPEQVVDLAQGNPRRAVVLWRSKNEREATSASSAHWFLDRLSDEEKELLRVLCHAAENAPLGITSTLLRVWTTVALPSFIPSDRERVLNSLLIKLEREQLATVCRLTPDTFGDEINEVLPSGRSIASIEYVAPEILTAFPSAVGNSRIDPEQLQCALLDSGGQGSMAFVVAGLLQEDLEPYFRSTFRTTSLPVVPSWCKKSHWDSTNARQNYLLRAMRVNAAVRPDTTLSAERDCGLPDPTDKLQTYAFAVLVARIAAYQPASLDPTLPAITASSEKEIELYAEQAASLARRYQRAGRYAESWHVLKSLISQTAKGTVAHFVACYRALEFLNRRKQREGIVSENEAGTLICTYAAELIDYGFTMENVAAICDGLFYFVRSRELAQRQFSSASIKSYDQGLTFVEKHRWWRARRLQILLTHGSLHRHAAMRGEVEWEEFSRHHDAAFAWYERAFKSAKAHNNEQHVLNALAYMSGLLLKAMRFAPTISPAARRLIISRSVEVLALVRKSGFGPTLSDASIGNGNSVKRTIAQNVPLLLCLEAYGTRTFDEEAANQLRAAWNQFGADVANTLPYLQWRDRAKYCSTLATSLRRLNNFGECHDCKRMRQIHSVITDDLAKISRIAPLHRKPRR
jgi:ABC-type oligopeptide transport system ATPase subunit